MSPNFTWGAITAEIYRLCSEEPLPTRLPGDGIQKQREQRRGEKKSNNSTHKTQKIDWTQQPPSRWQRKCPHKLTGPKTQISRRLLPVVGKTLANKKKTARTDRQPPRHKYQCTRVSRSQKLEHLPSQNSGLYTGVAQKRKIIWRNARRQTKRK